MSLLLGLSQMVGAGAITKVGENMTDATITKARSISLELLQRFPNSPILQSIAAGQEIVDVEAITQEPESEELLEQLQILLANNKDLATKLEALAAQTKAENIQVAAKNFEAEELDAEVIQEEISGTKSRGKNQQTGFENVKVRGKATIKLSQKINSVD